MNGSIFVSFALLLFCGCSVQNSRDPPADGLIVFRKVADVPDGISIHVDNRSQTILFASVQYQLSHCPTGFRQECIVSDVLTYIVPDNAQPGDRWVFGDVSFRWLPGEVEGSSGQCGDVIESKLETGERVVFRTSQATHICMIEFRYDSDGLHFHERYLRQ